MPEVIAICGAANSGKTMLITRLIPALKERGLSVATLKHTHHQDIQPDMKQKDTGRHLEAGAGVVILDAKEGMIIQRSKQNFEKLKDIAARFLLQYDIVLAEGYKNEPVSKIEVWQKGITARPLCLEDKNLLAIVSTDDLPDGFSNIPVFMPDDIDSIVSFIIDKTAGPEETSLLLLVNGRKVPLKGFVKDFLTGGITGMVNSLRGFDNMHNLEIMINLKKPPH